MIAPVLGADLFETYVVTLIAAMVSALAMDVFNVNYVYYPIMLGGIALIATMIGTFFIRIGKNQNIMGALYQGMGGNRSLKPYRILLCDYIFWF